MKSKVTIQEIADFAGVSKFAVSRALSGKSGVSAQTREMILKAAGQLGYFKDEPNPYANDLQDLDNRKWNGTVLVLFPNIRYQNKESLYWGPVFDGISARLNQKGLDILTLTEPSGDHMFSLLNPKAIRGIITVGTISTQILLDIKRLEIPVVMVDHLDPAFPCDSIFTDNFYCMKEIMTKLISKGYRKYQFVGNIRDAQSFYERWIGFLSVLGEHGIEHKQNPALIAPEVDNYGEPLIKAIEEQGIPEVFVCANDTYALFLQEAAKAHGMDLSARAQLTGFDNTYENLNLLATVSVNKELLGMRAVDQLLWRLLNRQSSYEKLLIRADVMVRETVAASRDTETA